MGETYEVISLLAAPPRDIRPCQNGTVPGKCSGALRAGAKGNICKSGGGSGVCAARRAPSPRRREAPAPAPARTAFLRADFILDITAFHTTVTP